MRQVLERVQVREQVLNILRAHHLAVAGHIGTAIVNNVSDTIIVGGQSGCERYLCWNIPFNPGPFFPFVE